MGAIVRIVLSGIAAAGALPVAAAEPPAQRELLKPPVFAVASPITDRFALTGSYYRPAITTLVRYDNLAGSEGTLVDAEDTLGLKGRKDQGGADLMFRMGDRHRIHADFYQLARKGEALLEQPVQFGEDDYFAGERVLSRMELRRLGISYTYSLLRREKIEIGLGLAIHLLQLEGTLEAPARFVREDLDTAGPFPTLAADFTWRIAKRWSLNGAAQYLGLKVDEVDGGYLSLHGDVQYRAWRNLAFGLGYTHVRYRVDSTDPDFAGYFRLKYGGPQAFARVSF